MSISQDYIKKTSKDHAAWQNVMKARCSHAGITKSITASQEGIKSAAGYIHGKEHETSIEHGSKEVPRSSC